MRLGLSALLSLITTTHYYEIDAGREMFRAVGSILFAYHGVRLGLKFYTLYEIACIKT